MDPRALSQFRTFRWNAPDDTEHYHAVETTPDGLRWYGWSHIHGKGLEDETFQTYEAFRRDGPMRPLPSPLRARLDAWIAEHIGGDGTPDV